MSQIKELGVLAKKTGGGKVEGSIVGLYTVNWSQKQAKIQAKEISTNTTITEIMNYCSINCTLFLQISSGILVSNKFFFLAEKCTQNLFIAT